MNAHAPLVHYNAACMALAAAKSTDEVKDWRDKAEAMRAYAHQSKNRQLEIDAAEIRIRAERRLVGLDATERADVLALALTILRKDRALRLNLRDHHAEAVIVRIPLAVFQAGPRGRRLPALHRPALHRVVLPITPTPGDAA